MLDTTKETYEIKKLKNQKIDQKQMYLMDENEKLIDENEKLLDKVYFSSVLFEIYKLLILCIVCKIK